MDSKYLIDFFHKLNTPIIKRKKYSYISYHGLEESFCYILIDGVVKTSLLMANGREFNLAYIVATDIISILKDEVSKYTSAPFNVRIESEEATFFRIPRKQFWDYVKENKELQDYVRDYYRKKLSEMIESLQYMTMNGKKGAVCAFLYKMTNLFGKSSNQGVLIDFAITNEEIAGFCGITTRNSVNRIIHGLKKDEVVEIINQRILVRNLKYLEKYTQ